MVFKRRTMYGFKVPGSGPLITMADLQKVSLRKVVQKQSTPKSPTNIHDK